MPNKSTPQKGDMVRRLTRQIELPRQAHLGVITFVDFENKMVDIRWMNGNTFAWSFQDVAIELEIFR
jgi:hypothetical protein